MTPLVFISRGLARLHRWYALAAVLSRKPLDALDSISVGRLTYALMMTNRWNPAKAHRLLMSTIQRNAGAGPEAQLQLAAMATAVGDEATAGELLAHAAAGAEDPATRDAAGRLLSLHCQSTAETLRGHLAAALDRLNLPPKTVLLTLVPVSSGYLDLWQLWLGQTREHIGGCVIVLALDDAALAAVQSGPDVLLVDAREFLSWKAGHRIHPQSRGVLWYLRVLYLRDLVRRGYAVLVLDLDAIAVGGLSPMLMDLPEADVVAQKDHSIPMDVTREFGFVLCCGFMLWRSTPAACALLDRFAVETAVERDDQWALNHLLAREGLTERSEDAHCLRFRSAGVRFVCPAPSLVSRTLESGSVVRHFQQGSKSVADLRSALGLRP